MLVDEKRSKSVPAWDRPSQYGLGIDQDRFQTKEQLWNMNWLTRVAENQDARQAKLQSEERWRRDGTPDLTCGR